MNRNALHAALPTVEECMTVMLRMWEKWGNTPSFGYRVTWKQLFNAYRDAMLYGDSPERAGKFFVYDPIFGSGKSASLMVYLALCSKMEPEIHPGARVIVLLKSDADKFVQQLLTLIGELGVAHSAWAGTDYAVSWHSGNREARPKSTLSSFPVIASCHAGFEGEMVHEGSTGEAHPHKAALEFFHESPRTNFIDECLSLLAVHSVKKTIIQDIIGYIPRDKRVGRLHKIVSWLEKLLAAEGSDGDGTIHLGSFAYDGGPAPSLRELRPTLKCVRMDRYHGFTNKEADRDLHKAVNNALDNLQGLIDIKWARVKKGPKGGETISTAAAMVPKDWNRGGVVLDGSAMEQRQYQFLPNFIVVPRAATGALRRYTTAVMNIAWGFNTGRTSLADNARQIENARVNLPGNLPTLEEGADGLLITFLELVEPLKKVLPLAVPADLEKGTERKYGWHIIYWGHGTTGWNDFAGCKTVVVYGIQRLPEEYHANIERGLRPASQDVPETEYEKRERRAEAERLFISQACVTTLQGIGRSAFRRSVTVEGDCPPGCQLFILLSQDSLGLAIHAAIHRCFPGVVEGEWVYDATKKTGTKKPKAVKTRNAMVAYLLEELAPNASITKQELRKVTTPNRSKGSMDRFIVWFLKGDRTSQDFTDLNDAGIRYEPSVGRNASSFFKESLLTPPTT